ncbi:ComF family protein [Gracilibacillus alcaliphilus]|uniref:ComF family protein n=1 Tax=Gracilibacillus alcaliphilus TaxID=1401441 RepID=UPI00195C007D|nr:ComF family protein [Gracilibacillus alcaliphilus]MBM7679513.1 competence protein ComFC [Gracilibacillus alcaliphilus]
MKYCLICHQSINETVTWKTIFYPASMSNVCITCQEQLELIGDVICPKCGRKMPESTLCQDCLKWQESKAYAKLIRSNRSIFTYNSMMQEVMTRWKYRGDYQLKQLFAPYIQKKIKHYNKSTFSIVPIPLTKARQYERAFNQAAVIADMIAEYSKQPIMEALSRKEAVSEKQSKRTRAERIAANNPFFFCKTVKTNVLLVDDIYTTGMTLHHAASQLKAAGCHQVDSFTLIR